MELDYRKQGELKINMTKYVENMLNNFLVQLRKKDVAKTPQLETTYSSLYQSQIEYKKI
jgi:hypothetical protein